MESKVQEAEEVPRGIMDTCVTIRRAGRGVVVSIVPATSWRYELHGYDGKGNRYLAAALELPEKRERDPHNGDAES